MKILKESGLSDLGKGFPLLATQIKKRIGKPVYLSPIVSNYKNDYGKYSSVIMLIYPRTVLRFNILLGKNLISGKIQSVDIIYDDEKYKGIPNITLMLDDHNIIQTIDEIVEYLKDPRFNESTIIEKLDNLQSDFLSWISDSKIFDEYLVNSKKLSLYNDYAIYAKNNNKSIPSIPTFNLTMDNYLKSKGLENKYSRLRKVKPKKDIKLLSPEAKDLLNFVDNEMGKSLDENIEELKDDISILTKGLGDLSFRNLLIVTGEAGISKTSSVKEALEGTNYAYFRGGIKNLGDFYKVLYANNGRLLVIDDSDSIIKKNSVFRPLLLGMTDKGDKRRLSYVNSFDKDIKSTSNPDGKYPQNFVYEGALICITNLPPPKMDEAFKSRAILNIVESSDESVLQSIEDNLDKYYTGIDMEIKKEVLKFLKEFYQVANRIDFRLYEMCLMYFSSLPNIELARARCLKKIKSGKFFV